MTTFARFSQVLQRRSLHQSRAVATGASQLADHFDVCIVGGGMVGTALASSLSSSSVSAGLRIALIEAGDLHAPPSAGPSVYSNRVSSVTPESQRLLNSLGAWDVISDDHKKAYQRMQVWDGVGEGQVSFNASESSHSDAIAWIVDNSWMRYALSKTLGPAVEVINHAKVANVKLDEETRSWPIVSLQNGRTLKTRLLVGADGANSIVRTAAGIESSGWDYQQTAIVATLKLDDGTPDEGNNTAYQRFLPTGPIALLPLASNASSLVWSTTPAIASKLSKLSDSDFTLFVNAAFRNPLPDLDFITDQIQNDGSVAVDVKSETEWGLARAAKSENGGINSNISVPRITGVFAGSRAGFPLRLRLSEPFIKDRIALIGDAAHSVHPLAGQGLNLGLGDASSLSKVITDGVYAGQDIGQIHVLQSYAASRFAPNVGMLAAVDGIGRIFNSDFGPLVWARDFGMNITNRVPFVKQLAMRAASSF
ncbi:putative ubiquinone biosynthesis monooxygenase [Blyttiomyces sp. JEL0837]|nr:putative ubiquinone biosynthesis monooxygenase [Blyttiomyces sp. JEL0837]